ncbi:hypothetical protein [Persicobacter sp. CCB-QB2]|uniref:hypothetical protein n=1 Tax=Persicobacter sp. CCB-QB2 TaxID=1561025 RepID=UPI0006A986D7|nr:hypothetical protein [Persicobacter sp. CCB-QB2]
MTNDIKNTVNGDIDFSGGDVHWGESSKSLQQKVIVTRKGGIKRAPEVGVGAIDYYADEDNGKLINAIKQELEADNANVESVTVEGSKIKVNANY